MPTQNDHRNPNTHLPSSTDLPEVYIEEEEEEEDVIY